VTDTLRDATATREPEPEPETETETEEDTQMTEDIVGSHLKSQRGRGQNQDQTGSFTAAKSLPEVPNVSPPNAVLPTNRGADTTADLSKIKGTKATHDSMRARGLDDGSPGSKVPDNDRPVTRQATPGTFNRS
jgi:hypothetical protein